MAYRGHQAPNQQLLWRQESSSSTSSQSGNSPSFRGKGEFGGDGEQLSRFSHQRRCSSLPTGTVINHMPPAQRQREHSSASRLDGLLQAESDVLVQCLLEKVMGLTAEKQRLAEQNAELQLENQQLSTLVTDMADTLQQQQQQMRTLLQLQRQRLLQAASKAAVVPPQAGKALLPAQQQQQPGQPVRAAASHTPQQPQEEEDAEVSARLPLLNLHQDAARQQGQGQQSRHQDQQQQQERVAEWLQERGWQEWQEKLEPVSSSSSSSLVLAIEESLLRP